MCWLIAVVTVPRRLRQESLEVRGQPGLCSVFKAGVLYTVRPCFFNKIKPPTLLPKEEGEEGREEGWDRGMDSKMETSVF